MSSKTLIIGCGYIGRPLAVCLNRKGQRIAGWVHSEESAAVLDRNIFEEVIVGSVGAQDRWAGVNHDFDLVIHCASSGRGGIDAYKEVFQNGVRCIGQHLPNARKILVSSTSVYGQKQGEIVTEDSLTEPASETSRVLLAAEREALKSSFIVIRSAGIYGPERAILLEKLRRSEAMIEGDGSRWMNQIHQHDLVEAIVHLAASGQPGEIYNASDDNPVMQHDYYEWCAEFLRVPFPPSGPAPQQRKRGLTHKRISNAKLRDSGWRPLYPSFREGLASFPR